MRQIGTFALGIWLVGCGGMIIGERNSSGVAGTAGTHTLGASTAGQGTTATNLVGNPNGAGPTETTATAAMGGDATTPN